MTDTDLNRRAALIVLRVLPTAVRCVEVGPGPVTYRKAVPAMVPGCTLQVDVARRWTFRRTDLLGGRLLQAGFSPRNLARSGVAMPHCEAGRLRDPGEADDRLQEALALVEAGDLLAARAVLLDLLEEQPASLVAHVEIGDILEHFRHDADARAHFTAGIRLGLSALGGGERARLDFNRPPERGFVRALVGRARVLARAGRQASAAADLRLALLWDPGHRVVEQRTLGELLPERGRAEVQR